MRIINLTFLFFLSSIGFLNAQIRGVVVEEKTKLPIPFVSISYELKGAQKGVVGDRQGKFFIPDAPKQLNVSCLGYISKEVVVDAQSSANLVIRLKEQDFQLQELTVNPKNNPALRIIRKALANKDQNNYENYPDYSYRCYFKTTGDFQLSGVLTAADSVELKKFNMALFVSETVSLCRKDNHNVEEKIIATRTSGMKSPLFGQAMYVAFYKSISFYNNSIQIFGETESDNKIATDYLSPLCTGCLSVYNYQLEEEYVTANDTIYEISYFPKKNKNISGLKGTMFISSNGYAISRIIADPYEKNLITFKFKQDYKYVNGKWFPESMEEEIGFTSWHIMKNAYPACFIVSKIDSVSFDNPAKAVPNRLDRIFLDEKSIAQSHSIIENIRPNPLSEREAKSYHTVDSISRHVPIDAIMNSFTKIGEGKISINKLDLDFARVYSYNKYENTRIGLGLHTNENVTKLFSVGGYIGYGMKDKKIKYGGDIEFFFDRSHDVKLKYSYQNTLKEAGDDLPDATFISQYYRNLIGSRFDRCIENKLEATYHISRPLKIKASLSARTLKPLYDYAYRGEALPDYTADEMQFSLRYAPGARYSSWGYSRIPIAEGNPIFNITYSRGVNFLRSKSLTYNKWVASINVMAYNGRIGQSNLRVEGGYIDSPLPYGLLFTGEGSKDNFVSLLISNSFQTLHPNEFLSDRYVHAFYSHNFGSLIVKTKVFHPELLVAYNIGWGNLKNASDHAIDFQIKDRFYQESGLIIDNLIRWKYMNVLYLRFGIGGFYRHGYYHQEAFKDNLALKLTASISFK